MNTYAEIYVISKKKHVTWMHVTNIIIQNTVWHESGANLNLLQNLYQRCVQSLSFPYNLIFNNLLYWILKRKKLYTQ